MAVTVPSTPPPGAVSVSASGRRLAQAGGASIVDAYLATATLMLGLLTAAFLTTAMLRLHGEERAGRVDPILAAPITRRTWALSHLRTAVAGALVVSASAGATRSDAEIGRNSATNQAARRATVRL